MRKKQTIFLLTTIICFQILAVSPASYINPIWDKDMPDPAIVSDGEGNFYMYATNMAKKVPIYTSRNLVNWSYSGDSFSPDQMPTGLEGGGVWAPDVIHYKNKYIMAYSYSKGGEYQKNGIGLAIADSPKGPFKNLGMLFTSESIGVRNSIDPAFVVDKDKLYLLWGSFNGLFLVELIEDSKGGFEVKDMNSKKKVAGKAFEGSHIFKKGDYYYLFASVGRCCLGDNSSYRVVVGRSRNLFGPYMDSSGNEMLNDGYNFVLGSNEKFVGPGHGSSIITDKNGKTWYIYHSYIRGKSKQGRFPMLDEILWDQEGWPFIYKGSPSTDKVDAPVF